jgi:hypothetical protein
VRSRQDLQVKLRNRYRALHTATGGCIAQEIYLVVSWISAQSALMSILQEARLAEKIPHPEDWLATRAKKDWNWPTRTEPGRAAFVWDLLRHINASDQEVFQFLDIFFADNTHDEQAHRFAEQVTRPLIDYLDERIGDGFSILYTLERYVRQVEWFDQKRLYAEFSADTRQGEGLYDLHLREFLFREGFNMPFPGQRQTSVPPDGPIGVESNERFVCELKIYDGNDHGIEHIHSGVKQALQCSASYGLAVAHLIIVNLTMHPLQLPNDSPGGTQPPYLDVPGARVYLIPVRGLPREFEDKRCERRPLIVDRVRLLEA